MKFVNKLKLVCIFFISASAFGNESPENANLKSFEQYKKLADHGFAEAQCILGMHYIFGIGVEKNEEKAFEYFNMSAEQGNREAQSIVGMCYGLGIGVEKDETKAFERLKTIVSGDMVISAVEKNEENQSVYKFNMAKLHRIKAMNANNELKKAKELIKSGNEKIKRGHDMAHQKDYESGIGKNIKRVDNSKVRSKGYLEISEGEKMVQNGEQIIRNINNSFQSLYRQCDTINLKSIEGVELTCIPLNYENGILTVLAVDKVYSIKDETLDEESRKTILIYK